MQSMDQGIRDSSVSFRVFLGKNDQMIRLQWCWWLKLKLVTIYGCRWLDVDDIFRMLVTKMMETDTNIL